jgi:hypothetical protein
MSVHKVIEPLHLAMIGGPLTDQKGNAPKGT